MNEIELLQRKIMDAIYASEEVRCPAGYVEIKVVILHPDTYQLMHNGGTPEVDLLYAFSGKIIRRSHDVKPFDFEIY